MKRTLACIVLAASAAPAVGSTPLAFDVIELADGTLVRDVSVVEETLEKVSFERAGASESVPSQDVVEVRFAKVPDRVDEAREAYADGDPAGALEILDDFVAQNVPRNKTRSKWAPAYAAWRALEIRRELSDAKGVVETADTLIASFPDSRYVPQAMLAKADFQARGGDAEASDRTLQALDDLARERSLKRWELASRLARLVASGDDSEKRRSAIQGLAASAASFPGVRSEAKVAEADTYLADAAATTLKKAQELRASAKTLYSQVVDDPRSSARALAGAHTGLAEVLFYEGAAAEQREVLEQATLHGLRVAVLYRSETDLLPRALYFTMRAFAVGGERGRATELLAELRGQFPASPWTAEAEKYR